MALTQEIRAQIAYQQRLARQLGNRDALRFRAAMLAARTRLSRARMITLRPPTLLHPVSLRLAATDAEVYGQVIIDQEYSPAIMASAEVIVDCGANIGLTSAYFLSRIPSARVIAIEPFPSNAELCRRNLAPYGNRAEVIEGAIWNANTALSLNGEAGNEWGVKVTAQPGGRVRAFDIPSLKLKRIDILKIDIEGSEAILFDRSAQTWLPTVRNIVIELHGGDCDTRFREALATYRFDEIKSGELTICRSLEKI